MSLNKILTIGVIFSIFTNLMFMAIIAIMAIAFFLARPEQKKTETNSERNALNATIANSDVEIDTLTPSPFPSPSPTNKITVVEVVPLTKPTKKVTVVEVIPSSPDTKLATIIIATTEAIPTQESTKTAPPNTEQPFFYPTEQSQQKIIVNSKVATTTQTELIWAEAVSILTVMGIYDWVLGGIKLAIVITVSIAGWGWLTAK